MKVHQLHQPHLSLLMLSGLVMFVQVNTRAAMTIAWQQRMLLEYSCYKNV